MMPSPSLPAQVGAAAEESSLAVESRMKCPWFGFCALVHSWQRCDYSRIAQLSLEGQTLFPVLLL